ncbi:hypothetical protein Cgig2_000728 [Carnegiea gigantea]|uniref:RING-CH-type domain-containing protein n=1 Tax=Carnegiea gigantea TaxID=171969 RepID=A0A9Q1KC88_9CARY|nr:hypothetical protein Cgig2_000728 [Carnegiea gigantea]
MGEVVLFLDDLRKISYCRICQEAEFESCKELEAPCACSGTVKFAHRECIQRWCDEKGDTICEICLQRYEPGYTASPKQPQKIIVPDEVVNIRESMEASRADHGFTVLLLMRHLLDALNGGSGYYPFSIFTILLLKTCGIIVPMFIIIRTITALQNSIRRYRNLHDSLVQNPNRD